MAKLKTSDQRGSQPEIQWAWQRQAKTRWCPTKYQHDMSARSVKNILGNTRLVQHGDFIEALTEALKGRKRKAHAPKQGGDRLIRTIKTHGKITDDTVEGSNEVNKELTNQSRPRRMNGRVEAQAASFCVVADPCRALSLGSRLRRVTMRPRRRELPRLAVAGASATMVSPSQV